MKQTNFASVLFGAPARFRSALVLTGLIAACGSDPGNVASPPAGPAQPELTVESIPGPRPPPELVERVERAIAAHECVGSLERWDRLYSYSWQRDGRTVDRRVISFIFRQAGTNDFRPGRKSVAPRAWIDTDDRRYDLVDGRFFLDSGRLDVEYCGSNL
ncbi:MAG TPA: hypothetical protein VGB79_07105 [Allosphingosinicella sp.]|jgi:hypothetical protein